MSSPEWQSPTLTHQFLCQAFSDFEAVIFLHWYSALSIPFSNPHIPLGPVTSLTFICINYRMELLHRKLFNFKESQHQTNILVIWTTDIKHKCFMQLLCESASIKKFSAQLKVPQHSVFLKFCNVLSVLNKTQKPKPNTSRVQEKSAVIMVLCLSGSAGWPFFFTIGSSGNAC